VAILPAIPNTVVFGKLGLNKWRRVRKARRISISDEEDLWIEDH